MGVRKQRVPARNSRKGEVDSETQNPARKMLVARKEILVATPGTLQGGAAKPQKEDVGCEKRYGKRRC